MVLCTSKAKWNIAIGAMITDKFRCATWRSVGTLKFGPGGKGSEWRILRATTHSCPPLTNVGIDGVSRARPGHHFR